MTGAGDYGGGAHGHGAEAESDIRPIIVGGCYRSGTSLVRRLLDSHPRIHCGPEVKLFRDFYANYLGAEDPFAHLRFMATARSLLREGEVLNVLVGALVEIHERAARAVGKPRWADKVPENLLFLDEWQRALGDGWVLLHVVRNPLDTLASMEEANFWMSVPTALEERIEMYVQFTEAGLRFGEQYPDRYVRLSYEDLVGNPEATVRSLMANLGERFHPRQLEINSSPHQPGLEDHKAARASRIHGESVGRWRRVLDPPQVHAIERGTERVRRVL